MNKIIAYFCLSFAFLATQANAAQAPTSGMSSVFACSLHDGKTINDAWATLEAFAKMNVMTTAAADPGRSVWLWTPLRGASPYDYLWGVNSSSLLAMGQGMTDYYAAAGTPAMNAQFAATAKCISVIVMSEQLQTGAIGNTADRKADALVETFACKLHDGVGIDAVDKAVAYYRTEVAKIPSAALKTYASWLWKPYRGGTGESDFMFVGAYPDVNTWAQGDTDYNASKEGQAADAQFGATSRCTTAMWTGYWIVAPTAS